MSGVTAAEVGSFFLSLVVPVITGVIAAGFTAYFALTRFYREKWWEKKHAAYNQLIEKLFELKDLYIIASDITEMEFEAHRGERDPPKAKVDWHKLNEVRSQVHRLYVLSPISFSDNVRELLDNLLTQDTEKNISIYEEGYLEFIAYHEMSGVIQSSIDAIVADAKEELKFK
ncbi:hypothetical protein SMX70_003701 [Cronobacter sakazakii]|uniref:hypothetical protein n=1 Tax=Cronobacter dublinensis TaxID=413497 RepID=UPI000CFBECFF|nr:hypothetical protein [Cronobacter dublinensis]ELY3800592.1 hypothetical protein [Cronobacter sakazakii]ELY5952412.1 hypothetical protein [Cronobacter sakazakii]